jgi:hypothetical protein
MVFREKAAALMHGDINAAYRDTGHRVFRPTWAARTEATALETAAGMADAFERQLARIERESPADRGAARAAECPHVPSYCRSIAAGVDRARGQGSDMIVATQPYTIGSTRPLHVQQQREMAAMLAHRFQDDTHVRYVNLGDTIDLSDKRLSGDVMHPTDVGNARIAAALAPAVLESARRTAHLVTLPE